MSKKSGHILYRKLLYKLGQDFMDIQYLVFQTQGESLWGVYTPWVFILDGCSFHYAHAYGVSQVFRFVEGIWLHRKSRQIRKKNRKRPFNIIRAQHVLSFIPWEKWRKTLFESIYNFWGYRKICKQRVYLNVLHIKDDTMIHWTSLIY